MHVSPAGVLSTGDSILESAMLTARMKGRHVSKAILQDVCIQLLVGGVDTVCSSLTIAMYQLARGQSFGPGQAPTPADCPFCIVDPSNNAVWQSLLQ